MIPDQKLIVAINERRSVRRFHQEPVARTVVERILAAATRAPSAHNRQPWRFAILDDETSKQSLAKAMGERLRADRAADGDEMSAIDTDVSRSYSRITGAPVVIVVCADARVMDHYPDRRRSEAEYLVFREERYFQTGSDFDWAKRTARMKRKKSFNHLMRRRKL
jgi:coenzyme F420-0:L-glutamate ligase/coenzyme F420-1:gamma-L-glutamate ligase